MRNFELGLVGCWLLSAASCITVESDDCPEGTRGCACYSDNGCESTSLRCVDDVCVRQQEDDGGRGGSSAGTAGTSSNMSGAGNGGSSMSGGGTSANVASGDELCEGMWEAVSSQCSVSPAYRDLVVEDCLERRSIQPERCLDEYDAALGCMGSPSAYTCNDAGQGEPTGCTELASSHDACVKDGPASMCAAYPANTAIGGLQEGWGDAVRVQLALTFFTPGSLRSLDGVGCTFSAATEPPLSMVGWMSCWEAYDCGGCEMWLGYYEGSDELEESWFLIHPRGAAGGATCEAYSAFYRVLDPGQGSSNMGIEAPPTPPGSSSACDDCLDACSGLSSCCTGSGCICESSCKPTGCGSPARLCCGPYGDCFCTENCPY